LIEGPVKITKLKSQLGGMFNGRIFLSKRRSKMNRFSWFRLPLSVNQSPRILFFLLPLLELLPPIGATIPPQMKVNIKVFSGDPLQSRGQESNLFESNREMKMARLDAFNMKTTRRTTQTEWRAIPTNSSLSLNEERRKIVRRRNEPTGEELGWCTKEPKRRTTSDSNLLPCLKSQPS
jgi:hypothetical protein